MLKLRRPRPYWSFALSLILGITMLGGFAPTGAAPAQGTIADQLVAILDASAAGAPAAGAPAAATRAMLPAPGVARSPAPPQTLVPLPRAGARRLTLGAGAGAPGDRLLLTGQGYAPGQGVAILWDGDEIREGLPVIADPTGSFSAELVVPGDAAPGPAMVTAVEALSLGSGGATSAAPGSSATFTVLAGQAAHTAPHGPAPAAAKAWTVVIYMAADLDSRSNLNRRGYENLRSLGLAGGGDAQINVVALADLPSQPTRYYEIVAGATESALVDRTPAALSGRNLNTGDPQTFVDFMGFVGQSYPAQQYALILWSHGAGWLGLQQDETANDDWSMAELRAALSGGLARLGAPRYDLVLMDACHMAQLEVALEIDDLADYLVASAERVEPDSFPYQPILSGLKANPSQAPSQLAIAMVSAYGAYYGRTGPGYYPQHTASAIRLGQHMEALKAQVEALASALLVTASTRGGEITLTARRAAWPYRNPSFIDLGDFARAVRDNPNIVDAGVKSAADGVIAALEPGGVILARTAGDRATAATGMSIYFPEDPGKGRRKTPTLQAGPASEPVEPGYERLRIAATSWYRLLLGLDQGLFDDLAPSPIGALPPLPPPAAASPNDIVFARTVNNLRSDLYRMDSGDPSAPPLPLLSDGHLNTIPTWSNNGRFVAYVSSRPVPGGSTSGSERNLYLLNADGSSPDPGGQPRPLTGYAVNCPAGAGTGQTCLVPQVYAPNWFSDDSGLLYTLITYDLSAYPAVPRPRQEIFLVTPDGKTNSRILPSQAVGLGDDVQFTNADLKAEGGQLKYLLFSYSVDPGAPYTSILFKNNNLGLLDFTTGSLDPTDLVGFFINDNLQDIQAGNLNYVQIDYPAWRPGTDQVIFLYNRRGNPSKLANLELRTPPPPGVWERANPFYPLYGPEVYPTYDMGIMRIYKQGGQFYYDGFLPAWAELGASFGAGIGPRPSWRPVADSTSVVATYSIDGGFSYNVVRFNNVGVGFVTGESLTTDGVSYLPSWGKVLPEAIAARLEIYPRYVAPGPDSRFYLAATGLPAGAPVQFVEVTSGAPVPVAEVVSDSRGAATALVTFASGAAPRTFEARADGKTSNQDVVIPLLPSYRINLPTLIR